MLACLEFAAPPVRAATLYVATTGADTNNGQSWVTAKKTVAAGLAAAVSGDQVWVAAGTYVERITLKNDVALYGGFNGSEPQLTQRDWVTNRTVLDGNGLGTVVTTASGATISTRIDGFTIRNGQASAGGGGISCSSASPTIANNTITGNAAGGSSGGGVYCSNSSAAILNNIVSANTANSPGGGIYSGSGSPTIANNTIIENTASSGGGVYCSNSTPTISNNIVAFNTSGIFKSGGTPVLLNNCVYNPDGYNYSGLSAGTGDISVDPQLLAVGYGQVHLTPGSPCIGAGDDLAVQPGWVDMDGGPRIQGAHVDIGADEFNGVAPSFTPVIVRVSPTGNDANDGSSWASAKQTVQAGISAAWGSDGGEVWVAAGTYNQRIVLRPWAYLYGGFAGTETNRDQRNWTSNATILDGGSNGPVVSALCGHRVSGFDGFTVRNGSTSYGAGIYCSASSPMIANNTITGNKGANGSGIYCLGTSATISNNIITGNSGTYGSGIHCANSAPRIFNNTIAGNNSTYGSGIYCNASAPAILGNRISGNTATTAAGVYCVSSSPVIANNTIVGNTASDPGSGIYCVGSSSSPAISNNIVAFNSSGIGKDTNAAPALRNNCVYNPGGANYSGLNAGTGDISADPQLLALNYGQLHLMAGSPCIDAGYDVAVQLGWVDLDGEARIQGAHVDIGADEFNGVTPSFTPPIVWVSPTGNDANDGTSWASAKLTVQAGIDAVSGPGGGEVWVAAGTYNQRITLKQWTYLYGGFAGTETSRTQRDFKSNVTILDGGADGSVVSALAGQRASGIDGFTIRNGRAGSGGGIYCSNCSPFISNNTIMSNIARDNGVGGGIYCVSSSPTICNNAIVENAAAGPGGGVYCANSSPAISNNTITGNSSGSGGVVHCSSSSPMIANNIVAFNSSGIGKDANAAPVLSNNCVCNPDGFNYSGLNPGTGDIAADPGLVGVGYGQIHLTAESPCIDAGLDSAALAGWVDMDGEPRLQGAHVDIGADEFNGAPPPAFTPTIIRVSPTGNDANDGSSWASAKQSVQAGIDAAAINGGEVWVAAGTYNQRIILVLFTYVYGGFAGTETDRNQRNWKANVTVLDAGGTGGSVVRALSGHRASGLDGFTVRRGNAGGVYCSQSGPTISNNVIIENTTTSASNGAGISCNSGSPAVLNNIIRENTFISTGGFGGGVYVSGAAPVIANNMIAGNAASAGGGIYCVNSAPAIVNNTIVENGASSGGGIFCGSSAISPVIANNIVAFNSSGISNSSGTPTLHNNCVYNPGGANYSGLSTGSGDFSNDPGMVAAGYGQIHLTASSPCINSGYDSVASPAWVDIDGEARSQGTHIDIGADEFNGTTPTFSPTIIRVSPTGNDGNDGSTWASAKQTVQVGVDAASAVGGEVWVAAGVYNQRITLKLWTYLYGGFAGAESTRDERNWINHVTILDGGAAGSVVKILSGQQASSLDGFTIRNGSGTPVGPAILGAGIYCSNASPNITNNTITGNATSIHGTQGWGGGICCIGSSPVISNNVITDNVAGDPVVGGSGGGIYCASSSPTISNNTISGNAIRTFNTSYGSYGGGIYCTSSSSPIISNNRIFGNTVGIPPYPGYGGAIYCYSLSSAVIFGNRVAGNSASTSGGGVYCNGSSPVIANNTFVGNTASGSGGAVYCSGSPTSPPISNNILAFNSSGIGKDSATTPTLRNNCVYNPDGVNYSGLNAGTGDISVEPRLSALDYGEFHLVAGSPCINAGYDAAVQFGWADMDGEPRRLGLHVDIGADEYDGVTPVYAPTVVRVSPTGNDANDGSSWASAKQSVQAGIDAAAINGGDVWVAGGAYNQRITLKLFTYVYGGFAGTEGARGQRNWAINRTILDGNAGGSVVTAVSAGYHMSCVDGFVIRNGTGTLSGSPRYGGGVYCSSSPAIVNATIEGNTADYGGGIYCVGSWAQIVDSVIVGNTAIGSGGGMYNSSSSLMVANCSISGNTSPSGAGVYTTGGSPSAVNCVLWANTGPAITSDSGSPVFTYNDVQGGYTGAGNINLDPKFVRSPSPGGDGTWGTDDDDYGDLRLMAGSPCIDAGKNAAVPVGVVVDLGGHGRLFNDPATADCSFAPGTCGTAPIVDMGAYEFIAGDYDRDGDLDLNDLALFQACVSGPAVAYTGDCAKADLNRDGDVDQTDFGIFQRCYSGKDKPADPNCAG